MTGLRGEAAIVGIAELPAERRPTRPPLFTLDQYALLAKMVVEDAGVDPACINGLLTHGVAESAMFAPATLCEYLGLALDFGERVDLGGATSAGMVWRAAAAVELGVCDAALAVVPGSAFGACGEGYVRCCYATALADIEEALTRMSRFVQKYR